MSKSQVGNNLGLKEGMIYILPIVTKLTVPKWRSGRHCVHKQGLVLEICTFKSQFVLDLSLLSMLSHTLLLLLRLVLKGGQCHMISPVLFITFYVP